ncbi:LysR family transcriptional regulator [Catellatospora citrea]|uniref:LysR family transcriptional regulator n=1 Tax=Catellatospora citrea TaxID=53366 RepID=A0A8J3KTB1_9ACTN|nr:LysR family transcriptional regulator [Catellatospora citrea]RKE12358.1 DNA-binding transcriptional LysR family regulator [Catellatospora citrea]GIG00870.1 LysR family transcriptional regulator [Catellatospora citrea]
MLDVRRLRLLRDLARLGTIAAVAEAHTYSPSAVSQQLATLQREAGVPLIERTGRGVTLTPAGTALVRHTETVLAALEAASATLAAARTGLHGTVRIGAFPTAVRTLLPAALVALARDHPALDLTVTELDPVAMPDALRERRLDVALLHDYDLAPVVPDPTVDSTPLLDETVYLAVPDDFTVGDDPVHAARDADWIVGTPGTLCHTVAIRVCQAAGHSLRARHHADDFTAVLALVAAGQGVALVPQLGAVQPPPGVRLVPLASRRRTRIAYRRGAGDHPAVAACIAAIRTATTAFLTEQA